MIKRAVMFLFVMGLVATASAQDRGTLARFEGGIGVMPISSGAGAANSDGTLPNVKPNVVRGISPAGAPWTISELSAIVGSDGRIRVRGRGLLLAGGNAIGQNGNQSVFATLICEPAAPFIERNTNFSVPLQANGDFRIDDALSPVASDCASPVLLIRSGGNGTWFAAAILRVEGE